MNIDVSLDGEHLTLKRAAQELRRIADLLQGGNVHGEGFNAVYAGQWTFDVDLDHGEHLDYWDGEHNHIHVDEEGVVVYRRGPDSPEGEEDVEQLYEKGILVTEWAAKHGGITPFGTPEVDGGDKPEQ
jgi:hypothetical protein